MSTPRTLDETLSPHPTPFLGRQSEVAGLCRLLGDPACRLITLTGPGGIGKTRLAREVAARVGERFADGVAFAALQAVPTADFLASAIVDALHVPLQGQESPQTQLLQILRDRRQLLVLDNFEHLLDGAGLLLTLLRAAPELTILATSREVLNLREEWLYPVSELDLPSRESGPELLQSSAVQLFTVCARRVRHDFDPEAEGAAVARICRLVAGMPLAIELARISSLGGRPLRRRPPASITRERAMTKRVLTYRLARHADLDTLRAVMDAAISELQTPFLDEHQIASSRAIMGLDTQLIEDGTYFVVEEDGSLVGCGGWSRRATLYGGDQSSGRSAALGAANGTLSSPTSNSSLLRDRARWSRAGWHSTGN